VSFWRREGKAVLLLAAAFGAAGLLPLGEPRVDGAILQAFHLLRDYAREHVILCLLPAFFIAGAIAVFVSQGSVLRFLGPRANPLLAYGVASVSGSVLAVCSCTVLPLFAGIHRRGAGLGPATTFLYSGPAINVLAIVLTARVLGLELGVARAVGAIVFSVVIGAAMHFVFRREESGRADSAPAGPMPEEPRSLGKSVLFFFLLVAILVVANAVAPADGDGPWAHVARAKWAVTAGLGLALALVLGAWHGAGWGKLAIVAGLVAGAAGLAPDHPPVAFLMGLLGLSWVTSTGGDELGEWFESSWGFAKQILPLLAIGVLAAGLLLGRPGAEGLFPGRWIAAAVGGNSPAANLVASVAGALMYFATLTEIPILEGLLGQGMGKGPALALLLAGPALSLPNMLVIRSVMGSKKTAVYVALVVLMATTSGTLYGTLFP
jgi:uncharacterized membrane protein YraQ (UPF0718 family)